MAEPAAWNSSVGAAVRHGLRLFISVGDQPRARRSTDIILLTGSLIGILLVAAFADPEPGYSRAVSQFLAALPDAFTGLWQVLADAPLVWGGVLLIVALSRGQFRIARDMALATGLTVILWFVLGRLVDGTWPLWDSLFGDVAPPVRFPAARLGLSAALIISASPHLVRPARRLGRVTLVLGGVATVALQASFVLGVFGGILLATAAAAMVHLIVGSSAGRPSLDDVRFALDDMNIEFGELGIAELQDAGYFSVSTTDPVGDELIVKLYGRDAYDAAVLSAVWRTVWLRRPGAPTGFGRLHQVEHEALMTLLAAQAGIVTDQVVTAGATPGNDAVLVLRRTGTPVVSPDRFDERESPPSPHLPDDEAPGNIRELWSLVSTIHENGIAHGQLDEARLITHGGHFGLIDFRGATVAPTEARTRGDAVQMFVTTIGLFGRDAAVAGLIANRTGADIEMLLPYMQSTTLTSAQRRMLRALDIDLDGLRGEVAALAGLEEPPLVKLRRFSVGSVVRIVLPALAIVILASALAGFDLEEFLETLQGAIWWLVLIGFVIAQLPRIAQAVSTLGAAPVPLPLGPVYGLQLAISYVNLAIPSAAARIAVNVRFFQRQGVPPGAALATGALDGVSGFIVQALLLTSLLLFSSLSLDVDVGDPTSAASTLLRIILIVITAIAVVLAAIPRLRRLVIGAARRIAHEAWGVLRGLRSMRRLVLLFGGNLFAELFFALALGLFVQAFGYSLAFHELLFINMAVSLLAGLIPVPGGVGVTEGGLIYGLTSFGVPQETAFAAVILYRLGTFYLPPIWGFFSLRWLERHRYL